MRRTVLVAAVWIFSAAITSCLSPTADIATTTPCSTEQIASTLALPKSLSRTRSPSTAKHRAKKRVIHGHGITHAFMRSPFPNIPYSWILRLQMVGLVLPAQPAAAALNIFYDRMVDQIRSETTAKYNAISWQYGDITLEMRSRDPHTDIPFLMVYNLLQELRAFTERALVGTYEGEVASAVTTWSIWIRLRIAGV